MALPTDPPANVLEVTGDGSHTLRSQRYAVAYHSTHGAIQESEHVFMQAGIIDYLEANGGVDTVRVLEMGFGTGLNALLTGQFARDHPALHIAYHSVEAYPISDGAAAELNYPDLLGLPQAALLDLHRQPYEARERTYAGNFTFAKYRGDFLDGLPEHWPVATTMFCSTMRSLPIASRNCGRRRRSRSATTHWPREGIW